MAYIVNLDVSKCKYYNLIKFTFTEVMLETNKSTEQIQKETLEKNFKKGMQLANLEGQQAPWVVKGLKVLEDGKELTIEMLKEFNKNQ